MVLNPKKTNTPTYNKSDDSADEDVVSNDSLLIKWVDGWTNQKARTM